MSNIYFQCCDRKMIMYFSLQKLPIYIYIYIYIYVYIYISFTDYHYGGENNNMFPFLEVLVEKKPLLYYTWVYWKPNFTRLYISLDSFALEFRKGKLVKYVTNRTLMICSESRIDAEIKTFTDIFLRNGYPDNVISSSIRSTISKFNSINSFCPTKSSVSVKLPWIGAVRQLLADNIFGLIMHCFNSVKVRTIFTWPTFYSSQRGILIIH